MSYRIPNLHDPHAEAEAAEERALDADDAAEAARKTVAVLRTQLQAAIDRHERALDTARRLNSEARRLRALANWMPRR